MKSDIQPKSPLEKTLTITIEKEDYRPRVNAELSKKSKNVQMKGFRKGKVPSRMIKKMYGQSLLVEAVNQLLDEEVRKVLEETDFKMIGRPLPSEDQKSFDFNPETEEAFEFSFDIGVYPDVELKGIGEETSIEMHDVQVPDDTVTEELDLMRRKQGKQVEVEDGIEEKDILTLEGKELEDGELKEKGWETSFTIMVDLIADEDLRKELLSQKKGYTFQHSIYELEKERDEKYVKKYFLNMDEEEEHDVNPEFHFEVLKVERLHPADMDEEFYEKAFGEGEVSNEEEAREKIRENIKSFYDQQAEAILYRDMQEMIMEMNTIELPDDFLKRFLVSENEEMTMERVEAEYDDISKNFQWTIIRNELIEKYQVKVEQQEIRDVLQQQVSQYLGGYAADENFMNSMVDRLMQDQKQVDSAFENKLADKLFDELKEEFEIKKEPIDLEEFKELIQKINKEANAGQETESQNMH